MGVMGRGPAALLGVGILAQLGGIASSASADSEQDNPLQIYGLTLDETQLGDGFREAPDPAVPMRHACDQSRQSLPPVGGIDVQTTPAPHVTLSLAPADDGRPRDVRIWYSPREEGGLSFMISTVMHSDHDLDGARSNVLAAFGTPTVEFTHADMEARGIRVADLTIDTLLYVDRALPNAQWARIAHRLRTEFKATGAELFSLTNTRLSTLARLLGSDFRGAIVQISESGWSRDSTVTTILLDMDRARSIFRLDG